MQRRRFLTLTGLSLGAASAALGSRADAGTSSNDQGLEKISANADKVGKPLILIPVPSDNAGKEAIQRAWGELFSTPNDEQLSLLALFEFAFGEVPAGVHFSSKAHCALFRFAPDQAWQAIALAESDSLLPATLFQSVNEALAGTVEQREALIQRLHAVHHFRDLFPIENCSPTTAPRLKLADADAGAPILYHRVANSKDEEFKRWGRSLLASAAALRLYEANPAGAQWKTTFPEVDPCPPCGMAIVQGTSKLFLDAYTSKKR